MINGTLQHSNMLTFVSAFLMNKGTTVRVKCIPHSLPSGHLLKQSLGY